MQVDVMERRFQRQLREALCDRLKGSYKSKAYKAYIERCIQHYAPRPKGLEAVGAALALHMQDQLASPGFARLILGGPEVEEYRRKIAEIKQRVDAIMLTILPYSRRFYYPNKEPK
jgi:hypothetical protein